MVLDPLLNKFYELLLPHGCLGKKGPRRPWVGSCKMDQFRVEEEESEWNKRDEKHKIQEVFRS